MSVDLSNLIPSLNYEINPPGQTVISMSDTEALNRLIDSWWELRLAGIDILANFTCDDNGIVSVLPNAPANIYSQAIPAVFYSDDGSPELGREIQQLIVLFAGYRITLTTMANLNTSVMAKAGSVESSTAKSATLLVTVIKALKNKIDMALTRLSDLGMTNVAVIDAVMNANDNLLAGNTYFVNADYGRSPMGPGYREFN